MIAPSKYGIYLLHWEGGGFSLAAVGGTFDGTKWYAPINWTTESKTHPAVASTNWTRVKDVTLILDQTDIADFYNVE